MDEAARALITFLTVIGAVTTGVVAGMSWLYLRGELTLSLTRAHPDDDCPACAGRDDTDWWK